MPTCERMADLRDADLRDAYLRDADLRDADLRGAYLSGADLRCLAVPTGAVRDLTRTMYAKLKQRAEDARCD